MTGPRRVILMLLVSAYAVYLVTPTPFEWMGRDAWDTINEIFSNVSAENCRSKDKNALLMPNNTIAAVPKYNQLLSSKTFSNRSALLHVHNMALNRAFFYSLIYQQFNNTFDFNTQPGLMYIYMSAAADISASPGFINGSGIFFDNNCTYPNWYTTIPFNETLPLFGPKAWREDDYNEATNFLREPTNNTIDIWDLAAGNARNYTDKRYKGNPWVGFWLPDVKGNEDSPRKFSYTVGIKYSNTTGRFTIDSFQEFPFFGPAQPGSGDSDDMLPVRITQPYFDCGHSNRWIVTASSPVVEYMPRYLNWTHMRRPRFTAVATIDMEFERIDMNQCPITPGNTKPNIFADTARCRKETTACEPLPGYGFRRGGYHCVCLPGYYYPWWHDGPFLGREIEEATHEEYLVGFDCLTVRDMQVIPTVDISFVRKKRSVASLKDMFMKEVSMSEQSPRLTNRMKRSLISRMKSVREEEKKAAADLSLNPKLTAPVRKKRLVAKKKVALGNAHKRTKRSMTDESAASRMRRIINRFRTTNKNNCHEQPAYKLFLPGDAAFGAETQFEAQGRTALRLAHFLSNFLQNVDEYEEFGNLKGDRRLNETQIYAEVIANVIADWKVMGCGVFFDRFKFRMSPPVGNTDPRFDNGITREFFGPFAYREPAVAAGGVAGGEKYRAIDFAGFSTYYTDETWFRDMKARWATNFVSLKTFTTKPMIRSNYEGDSLIRFEYYPYTYRAVKYEDGEWLRPQFKCDGMSNSWVVTYVAPFFGKDDIKDDLEFKGIVTIDVALEELSIDQCPAPFHVPNAFKNTARCDYESQYCVTVEGKEYREGFYKCECREGFEYPFKENNWYFDGQTMEEAWKLLVSGKQSRYETLKCRKAGVSAVTSSAIIVFLLAFVSLLVSRTRL